MVFRIPLTQPLQQNSSSQEITRSIAVNAVRGLHFHWPEYLMEAAELASYMFVVCATITLFQHPASPIREIVPAGI